VRILIVDDEPDIRRIAGLALRKLGGHELLEAENGMEALRLAAEHKPDVILLDVMMPLMDGPTTLAALKQNVATASIPVVFLTAKAIASEVERFKRMGALAALTKPFDPMTLDRDLKAALGRT
jgi:two-component system OmpR family response regulator